MSKCVLNCVLDVFVLCVFCLSVGKCEGDDAHWKELRKSYPMICHVLGCCGDGTKIMGKESGRSENVARGDAEPNKCNFRDYFVGVLILNKVCC
jgi:hypothetical protein